MIILGREELRLVRRIAVCPTKVIWSENGELCIIACEASFYMLRYNKQLASKYFDQGIAVSEQGIPAFTYYPNMYRYF